MEQKEHDGLVCVRKRHKKDCKNIPENKPCYCDLLKAAQKLLKKCKEGIL